MSNFYNEELENFKRRVSNSPSRNLGEGFMQPIMYKIYGHEPSLDASYDGLDGDEKIEYKTVRALFRPKKKKNESLYDEIMEPVEQYDRLGKISDIENNKIVVNVQNVKPHTFDYLMYIIVGMDGFDVYKISKKELEEKIVHKEFPGWSGKHGREDKVNRNCQFHITSKNIEWHNQYKINHFDWEYIAKIAKETKKK